MKKFKSGISFLFCLTMLLFTTSVNAQSTPINNGKKEVVQQVKSDIVSVMTKSAAIVNAQVATQKSTAVDVTPHLWKNLSPAQRKAKLDQVKSSNSNLLNDEDSTIEQ